MTPARLPMRNGEGRRLGAATSRPNGDPKVCPGRKRLPLEGERPLRAGRSPSRGNGTPRCVGVRQVGALARAGASQCGDRAPPALGSPVGPPAGTAIRIPVRMVRRRRTHSTISRHQARGVGGLDPCRAPAGRAGSDGSAPSDTTLGRRGQAFHVPLGASGDPVSATGSVPRTTSRAPAWRSGRQRSPIVSRDAAEAAWRTPTGASTSWRPSPSPSGPSRGVPAR